MFGGNESDIDSDYDENDENDENLKNPMRDEIQRKIIQIKKELYNSIIFTPKLNTKEAQNPALIQIFLNKLNELYILMHGITNGNYIKDKKIISMFPINTHSIIEETLNAIIMFFKQNQIDVTIPLSDFIERHLKETPFIQDDELIRDD